MLGDTPKFWLSKSCSQASDITEIDEYLTAYISLWFTDMWPNLGKPMMPFHRLTVTALGVGCKKNLSLPPPTK